MQLSPKTTAQINNFVSNPSQAVIINGAEGTGTSYMAMEIASKLLDLPSERLIDSPFFKHIQKADDAQNITIDEIRKLIKSLSLKIAAIDSSRIIFIENAEYLNTEAQNALLKSLEEPGKGTIFILTTSDLQKLLPTIVSRCNLLTIQPLSLSEAISLYPKQQANDIQSAWHISGGANELMWSLLTSTEHELKTNIEMAKSFIKMDRYERAITLEKLSQNKLEFGIFLQALNKIIRALYRKSINDKNASQSNRLLGCAGLINESLSLLKQNVSSRLIAQNIYLKLNI